MNGEESTEGDGGDSSQAVLLEETPLPRMVSLPFLSFEAFITQLNLDTLLI